ncbi:hypothetical protein [Desulfobacterium sp. N47]|uniref:Uncharacterized protein n=1 Tax=uncultured Desulfobacterium sp. TaxID=201089 RepID=E1YAL0_9BACT|nr:hypothetical protein N47_H24260 [uncultured Desulfobacterium sp.]
MKIEINLPDHCIETEAKRLYKKSLTRFFESSDPSDPELEEKIDGLINFLEYTDFGHLRSSNPVLAGIEKGKAVLNILGENLFEIEVDGSIYKPRKKGR